MRSGGAIEHQHMGQATANSTKKKFGKNLSKLAKPPAPPIASEAKTSASSRNGLLLLSTKRPGNVVQGLLASKQPAVAAPPMSLGLQYESTASTHDVLLGAVVGASRVSAESSQLQQPDAWGVAAAVTSPTTVSPELTSTKNGNNTQLSDTTADSVISATNDNVASTASPSPSNGVILPPPTTNTATTAATPVANWDEYGRRSRSTFGENSSNNEGQQRDSDHQDDEDNQQAYMIRLAQERAERRRAEEEARANEQQEKAAQRLKELESRIAERSPKAVMSNPGRLNNATTNERSVLEKLGSTVPASETNPKAADPALSKGTTQQRTLYDPHRPYSVLVGGMPPPSGGPKASESQDSTQQHQPQQNHQQDQNGSRPRTKSGELAPGTYTGPVIHLTSYEDRDRGEVSRSAGPRMLFDPKSGSMVAVREESGGSGGGGGRGSRKNERRSKGFNIGGRGSGAGNADRIKGDENNGSNSNSNSNNKKIKQRSKNEKNAKDSTSRQQQSSKKTNSSSSTGKNLERKWPRTCGVLYARDEKGVAFCTDGCDGDLGYGAHSVPGGRLRNPDAYAKFSEQQQLMSDKDSANMNADNSNAGSGAKPQPKSTNSSIFQPSTTDRHSGPGFVTGTTAALQTGFVPETPESTSAPQPLPWVKPNEKIELILDNNPSTLQATAREWAPSEAALAAAAKVTEDDVPGITSVGSADNLDHGGKEDDDDSNSGVPLIGLGFDPNQISTVMQSPKLDPLEGVGLGALTLGAAFDSGKKNHNNIFAFGTSDTWGHTSPSNPDNNDWTAPLEPTTSGGRSSRLFGPPLEESPTSSRRSTSPAPTPQPFLSFATGSAWGAGVTLSDSHGAGE